MHWTIYLRNKKLIELISRLHFTSFTACARCFVSPSLALLFTILVFKRPNLVIMPPRVHTTTHLCRTIHLFCTFRSHRSRHLILPGIVKCTRQKCDQRKTYNRLPFRADYGVARFACANRRDEYRWNWRVTIDRSMISDHRPRIVFKSSAYLLIKPTLRNAYDVRRMMKLLFRAYQLALTFREFL